MKEKPMKNKSVLATFLLSCALLAACGKKEPLADSPYQGLTPGADLASFTERTEYYDITVNSDDLFDLDLWDKNPPDRTAEVAALLGGKGYLLLGTQICRGEPVQLWAELSSKGSDIYLYRKDGTSRRLLQGISSSYTASGAMGYQWYIDRDGDLYCYRSISYVQTGKKDKVESSIAKFLSTGEVLYTVMLESDAWIEDFCQTEDGGVYLLLKDSENSSRFLAQLDPSTGKLDMASRIKIPLEFGVYLGSAGDFPVVTGSSSIDPDNRVAKVNTSDGSLIPILFFTGTSYGWRKADLQDIQVLEDGYLDLLWTDSNGRNCLLENLHMEKVEKIPILVRGIYNDDWLSDRAVQFNAGSATYHVIIEKCGENNDGEDFSRLTSIQIGSGGGPDILCGDIYLDYIVGILEKGAFEALNPYMEASDIREEDYFPFVFSSWRQSENIYSINYRMQLLGEYIDEDVLGNRQTPDIETLVDSLLSWKGTGIYRSGYDPAAVLKAFLQGTDSLWGMVNWEEGSCDFNTPLFGKLLEASKQYGDTGRTAPGSVITKPADFESLFWFKGQAELEADGKVISGVLFDDGCHATFSTKYTLAMNANSPNKEGAWEFISYLLSEDCQSRNYEDLRQLPPVHRKVFETWLQLTIEKYSVKRYQNGGLYIPVYYGSDTSEEKQAEYLQAIEGARPLPIRTVPILTILLEETEAYFDGYKSAEEVSRTVNNRVQLYLDERK